MKSQTLSQCIVTILFYCDYVLSYYISSVNIPLWLVLQISWSQKNVANSSYYGRQKNLYQSRIHWDFFCDPIYNAFNIVRRQLSYVDIVLKVSCKISSQLSIELHFSYKRVLYLWWLHLLSTTVFFFVFNCLFLSCKISSQLSIELHFSYKRMLYLCWLHLLSTTVLLWMSSDLSWFKCNLYKVVSDIDLKIILVI